MSDTIIQVEHVSKKYLLGGIGAGTIRETLANGWQRMRGKQAATGEDREFWALRDINFEVKRGEVVGVIGKNGAGKSTLLKVLSRITEPTEGQIKLGGRIASLLEVGTGFHPELTGRENIFLNGSILGMSREEIKRKFDEIVEFSGVAKFLDTPVKRYSSGMYVRLAFAVAAHLEPEILVIDEVLAVGDAAFQKKCLGKMQDVASQGRTVLFVSHNMTAVKSLCHYGILLDKGQVQKIGSTDEIVSDYLGQGRHSTQHVTWENAGEGPGADGVELKEILIHAPRKDVGEAIEISDEVEVRVTVEKASAKPLDLTLQFMDEEGRVLLISSSSFGIDSQNAATNTGRFTYTCLIPPGFFNEGELGVNVLLVEDRRKLVYRLDGAVSVRVIQSGAVLGEWMGRSQGYFRPQFDWRILSTTAELES